MRNLVFLVFLFFSMSVSAQEVNKKQWSLINKKSADWCSLCGGWGWNFHKQLHDTFEGRDVLNWATHFDGGLKNQASVDITANFGGSSQPIFYVEGTDLNATPNNVTQKLSEAEAIIDFTLSQSPFAGIGIDAVLSSQTKRLDVRAKVEFLESVEGGDYFLGLYLVEDSVVAFQQNQGQMAVHRYLLRRSLMNDTWGKSLKKGAVAAGTVFDVDADLENLSTPRNKLYVAAIIWNKVNNKYLFFNGYQVPVGIPAASDDLNSSISGFKVFQTEVDRISVQLELENVVKDAVISVTDISGKTVSSRSVGTLNAGKHELFVQGNFSPGLHVVSINENNIVKSKKIIIQ
jgi:hypothetical protein